MVRLKGVDMPLGHTWAGRAFGTNIGNLFLKFSGQDGSLTGKLHFNDAVEGIGVFDVVGQFDGGQLTLSGEPILDGQPQEDGQHQEVVYGKLSAQGILNERGEITGEWQTTIGTAGTFHLFPHDSQSTAENRDNGADQLHTARYDFGPIEIDRDQVIAIANDIQREFQRVVVTIVVGTEQSRFLDDFKLMSFPVSKATYIKLFASKPDRGGINQVITVEFGQQANWVMTQGTSEAWVLGKLETLKRVLVKFERGYATNIKRLGIGINQFLLFGAIVFLPNLPDVKSRAILLGGAVVLTMIVNWAHTRFLPHSSILLEAKQRGWLLRLWPSVASWIIALTAGAAGTVLAAYLQGWLKIPSPPTAAPVVSEAVQKK
jgi:hypothetical protein